MNIIRYINGRPVEEKDIKKFEIESDLILKTIKSVNDRLKDFPQGILVKKDS